jgi:hypothetical protein
LAVDDAIKKNCQPIAPFKPERAKLCSIVCNAGRDSVSKSLTSCGDPSYINLSLKSMCLGISSNESTCFSGIKAEADLCGMAFDFLIIRIPNQRGS